MYVSAQTVGIGATGLSIVGGGWIALLQYKLAQLQKADEANAQGRKDMWAAINATRDKTTEDLQRFHEKYEKEQRDIIEKYATKLEVKEAVQKLEAKIEKEGALILSAIKNLKLGGT